MESYNCVLCNEQVEETVENLFPGCSLTQACWRSIHLNVDSSKRRLFQFGGLKHPNQSPFFYGDSHPDKLGNLDDQEQQDLQANQCFHCWLQELVSD